MNAKHGRVGATEGDLKTIKCSNYCNIFNTTFFFRSGLGAETDDLLQSTPLKMKNFKMQKIQGFCVLKNFNNLKNKDLIFENFKKLKKKRLILCNLEKPKKIRI